MGGVTGEKSGTHQVDSTDGKVTSIRFDFGREGGVENGFRIFGSTAPKEAAGTSPTAPPAPDCAVIYQNIVSLY